MTTLDKKSPDDIETSAENTAHKKHLFVCDRCGKEMQARQCKLICPNCGAHFDCSDLNLYFDETMERGDTPGLETQGDQHGI